MRPPPYAAPFFHLRARLVVLAAAVALLATATACKDPAPEWAVVFDGDDLDRALLSVWGSASDDVYTVGGGLGNDRGALVLHFDGGDWTEIDTGQDTTFWWVWGASPTAVFFGGEGGVIMRYDGGPTPPELMTTPTEETVFGIWGTSATDVWAAGGRPNADRSGFLWHLEGDAWVDRTPVGFDDRALFKVWGRSSDDFHVVGQMGTILHYDGQQFEQQDCGISTTLLTVHTAGNGTVWAVGGPPAVACYYDGSQWAVDSAIPPASIFNGVVQSGNGEVLIVGVTGVKMRKTRDGDWVNETLTPFVPLDLHGSWMDPKTGDTYAVGGNLLDPAGADRRGVVLYRGTDPPRTTAPQ